LSVVRSAVLIDQPTDTLKIVTDIASDVTAVVDDQTAAARQELALSKTDIYLQLLVVVQSEQLN